MTKESELYQSKVPISKAYEALDGGDVKKAREFWIVKCDISSYAYSMDHIASKGDIHVIEKSAYKELMDELCEAGKGYGELKLKADKLAEALRRISKVTTRRMEMSIAMEALAEYEGEL